MNITIKLMFCLATIGTAAYAMDPMWNAAMSRSVAPKKLSAPALSSTGAQIQAKEKEIKELDLRIAITKVTPQRERLHELQELRDKAQKELDTLYKKTK